MDSLGKVFDIFIMAVVFFIFPVLWVMDRTEQTGMYALGRIASDFLYVSEKEACIDAGNLNGLDNMLENLYGDYSASIIVKRRIWDSEMGYGTVDYESIIPYGTILDEIGEEGRFMLNKNDTLIVEISDAKSLLIRKARTVT